MPNYYEFDIQGEKVHIGEDYKNFIPKIRFNKWNLESYVELNLIGGGNWASFKDATLNPDGSIFVQNNYISLHYQQVAPNPPYNDIGGVDFTIVLKQNPGLNTIGFTYNHQNCTGYLQPPLTQQEIDDGQVRPDYVVNSIAFYHDTKGGMNSVGENYKIGKIGHLYRMRVIDSALNETWADWDIDGGTSQIHLTIPADYLANAVYPVNIQPVGDTFGYNTVGATNGTIGWYVVRLDGDTYTGAAGTATSMSFYGKKGGSAVNVQMALYDTNPDKVGSTDSVAPTASAGWWQATFSSPPAVSAIEYYLCILNSADIYIYYDTTSTNNFQYQTIEPFLWPATGSWTDGGAKRKYSIYCTYTPGGGAEKGPITTTANLTSSATVAYAMAWDRGISPLLTMSITIDRDLDYIRALASANLTSSITLAKAFGQSVIATADLVASITIGRAIALTRTTTANLTSNISLLKSWGQSVAVSAGLVVSSSIARAIGFTKTVTSNLTSSPTVTRATGLNRATLPGLTVSPTLSKFRAKTKTITSNLDIGVLVDRGVDYIRAATADLTGAISAAKSKGQTIASTANLSISTTLSRAIALTRGVAANLVGSAQVSATTIGNYLVIFTTNLATSVLIDRTTAIGKAITKNLDISASINRALSSSRAIIGNLNISVSLDRVIDRIVAIVKNLTLSVTTARHISIDKAMPINLGVSITMSKVMAYARTVTSNITSGISIVATYTGGITAYAITLTTNLTVSASIGLSWFSNFVARRFLRRPTTTSGSDITETGRYGGHE